jgi:cold shock CspA family protein
MPLTPDQISDISRTLAEDLSRRQAKRDAEEEQRWREESGDDCVYVARRYLDRIVARVGAKSPEEAAAIVMASVGDNADRERLERVEKFAEQIVEFAKSVAILEALRAANIADGSAHRPRPTMRVRSANQVVVPKPRPDPAAPRQERIGRRSDAPRQERIGRRSDVATPAPSEVGDIRRGVVVSFDQRSMGGVILEAGSGKEIAIAEGAVQRAGLTNLFPQQRVEFRIEADQNGRKAESIKLV